MSVRSALSPGDLASTFRPRAGAAERIGVEVEVGLVDPRSGVSVPYTSGRALLEAIATAYHGRPVFDGAHLIAVALPSGAEFSLETGCALEYSSAPYRGLAETVARTRTDVEAAARLADDLGIAVLSGGMLPFTAASAVPWNPKPRVAIMRRYFARLGEDGCHADGVMGLVLATQTSLDYTSEADLFDKLRLLVAAAPVVAALFVGSPIENGVPTGALSRRMQLWRHFEARRCGVLGFALRSDARVDDMVDWALRLPMIYRSVGGRHVPAPFRPFAEILRDGFGDGTWPTLADWELHLCQVWPHVRLRRTLETRAPDAPPWAYVGAVPAIWTGLTYDPATRRAASALLDGLTAESLDRAVVDIAVKGLGATVGPYPVQELARELVRLARRGLRARVTAGLEPPDVVDLLAPIEEVAETGRTFAEDTLSRWNGPWRQRPSEYVRALRI